MKCFIKTFASLALATASLACFGQAAAPVDRLVRTSSHGDIPMLDDLSLALLAGATPEEALATKQAFLYEQSGFWSKATHMGIASIPSFRKLDVAGATRRDALLKTQLQGSKVFWLPAGLVTMTVSQDQARTVTMPVTIDSQRFTLGEKVSHVCAYGRKACIQLDNVTVSDTVHRTVASRPYTALLENTTLLRPSVLPVYGLVIEVRPGVNTIEGRRVVVARALRGSYIDVTQCIASVACGEALSFDVSNGAGAAGWAR